MLQAEQILGDRYQLKQKLGQNSGRQTWLADDLNASPPEPVVIKLLAFGGEVQWDDLKLFEREAQILRHLDHTQIPKYRDYFNIDDRMLWFALVQTYIPGICLKDLLVQGKRFSSSQVQKIAKQILEILIYLHELHPPVIHRDLKPSNLILGENQKIYLVDFGAVQDKAAREGSTFTVVGTYGYAPLEQFGGRTVPASDLYALGATLVHLMTGIAPADLPQSDLKIQFSSQINADPYVIEWLGKMMEPALEKRFQTARQALTELEFQSTQIKVTPPQKAVNNSGQGAVYMNAIAIPNQIKGWNWGAFLLPWFWVFQNRVWLGLLIFIGWPMAIVLGIKGNEWAWRSRRWNSLEQFQQNQRYWAIAGFTFWGIFFCVLSMIL